MTNKESVRRRMESEEGISYTEFTYQLLQGYDFVHMCREMGVRVQVSSRGCRMVIFDIFEMPVQG